MGASHNHRTRARRIVLLTNRSLLGSALERLLKDMNGLEFVTVAGDDPNADNRIKEASPHVIMLDSGDPSLGELAITRMLSNYPYTKVIALNLNHTSIDVYERRRSRMASLDGLLNEILGNGAQPTDRIDVARPSDVGSREAP